MEGVCLQTELRRAWGGQLSVTGDPRTKSGFLKAPPLSGRMGGSSECRRRLVITPLPSPILDALLCVPPGASAMDTPASVDPRGRAGWLAAASTTPRAPTASAACPSSRTARGPGAPPRPPTSVCVSVLGHRMPLRAAAGWEADSPRPRGGGRSRHSWRGRLFLSPPLQAPPSDQTPRGGGCG